MDEDTATAASRAETIDDDLLALGFTAQGATRRGGWMYALGFNSFLEFTVHRYDDAIVFTWSCALGDYLLSRGFQLGAAEVTFQELYPQSDVRLPLDIDAVRGEITRVLASLRLDPGDPSL